MTNPILRAFTDLPQDDWHSELTTAELGPVSFEWDPNGKGRWVRPAADYATYSDGTPPDPAHENAGDRAARKTAELKARRQAQQLIDETNIAPQSGPQPLYYGHKQPPEPAPSFWRPKLDKAGVWSAYATAAFCIVCLVFLFT